MCIYMYVLLKFKISYLSGFILFLSFIKTSHKIVQEAFIDRFKINIAIKYY